MEKAIFNITFGEDDDPLLEHFEDIIYPAFTSDIIIKANKLQYEFNDVKLIKNKNTKFVLVGNLVKHTTYTKETEVTNNEIVYNYEELNSSPFSRFIIFLENHRMMLIKNENNSPDIRSFQLTTREILKRYKKEQNKTILYGISLNL